MAEQPEETISENLTLQNPQTDDDGETSICSLSKEDMDEVDRSKAKAAFSEYKKMRLTPIKQPSVPRPQTSTMDDEDSVDPGTKALNQKLDAVKKIRLTPIKKPRSLLPSPSPPPSSSADDQMDVDSGHDVVPPSSTLSCSASISDPLSPPPQTPARTDENVRGAGSVESAGKHWRQEEKAFIDQDPTKSHMIAFQEYIKKCSQNNIPSRGFNAFKRQRQRMMPPPKKNP